MDNIRMGERLAVRRGRDPKTIEDVWEIFPALESMAQKGSGLLSGGQRQMLALATAFMSMPSVLLLDEPSAGLAPEAAATAFDALTRFRNDGMCVLVAEQNVDWLQGITSHRIELESGRVVDAPSVDSGSKDAMDAS
jgi:ABC-type branched-subunit amino acid transport system ATPase component